MSFPVVLVVRELGTSGTPTQPRPNEDRQDRSQDGAQDPSRNEQGLGVEFGIALPEEELGSVDHVSQISGQRPQRFTFYKAWGTVQDFDVEFANAVYGQGMTPLLTWEPMDPDHQPRPEQPEYSLASIIRGDHDAYIERWARQIRDWGRPLWIRFAHEMNANFYPWCAGVNGNTPGQYVQAYRHVHDVIQRAGVNNVRWNWSVNVVGPDTTPLHELYPGDAYVDEVGIDGYNGGTQLNWGGWKSWNDLFGQTLAEVRSITSRPIHITETGSAESGGDKAQWIRDFFAQLRNNPDIAGFTWFNFHKEADWRINSSPAAQQAFREGLAAVR